jgi:hypothetical protein
VELLRVAHAGEERTQVLRGLVQVACVYAHVELRQVEPEELDPLPERGQPAIGDPRRAVRAQAAVDDL